VEVQSLPNLPDESSHGQTVVRKEITTPGMFLEQENVKHVLFFKHYSHCLRNGITSIQFGLGWCEFRNIKACCGKCRKETRFVFTSREILF
jgi:hypothetical protein